MEMGEEEDTISFDQGFWQDAMPTRVYDRAGFGTRFKYILPLGYDPAVGQLVLLLKRDAMTLTLTQWTVNDSECELNALAVPRGNRNSLCLKHSPPILALVA